MPAVPSHLLGGSALFDPTPYPVGLFDIPEPGSPGVGAGVGTALGGGALTGAVKAFMNGGGLFGGAAKGGASAVGGFLGSKLGTWGEGNAGSKIGGMLGSLGGSFLGPAGSFMGGAIGSALGGNFGPPPTVGPNGQAWLGNSGGRLGVLGSSGDNGLDSSSMPSFLQAALGYANRFPLTGDLPRHFQVRAGENKMDPTIELGPYMAPMLNDMSLARALAKRGYLNAPGIGEDPARIFSSGKWLEPESIHSIWGKGIHEVPNTGFHSFDSARASPDVQRAIEAIGPNYNESLLAQYAANPALFAPQQQPTSLFG